MFYKLDNQELLSGPEVICAEYQLLSELHESYQLPIDGWYWFDTDEEANAFFGLGESNE